MQIYSLNKKTQILNNDEHLAPKACMYVFFLSRRQARRLYKILFHLYYICCFFVNNNNLSISAAYFQCYIIEVLIWVYTSFLNRGLERINVTMALNFHGFKNFVVFKSVMASPPTLSKIFKKKFKRDTFENYFFCTCRSSEPLYI